MKHILYVIFLSLVLSCGGTKIEQTVTLGQDARSGAPKPLDKKDVPPSLSFSDSARVGEIIGYLASDELKGREAGTEGINKAAVFAENIFKKSKVAPFFETYRDTLANFDRPTYNIVGYLEGTDKDLKNEFVIIGAHYDHIGIVAPVAGDSIANGANDNASGTTAVLEFARYFGKKGKNKRSIIFALFSAEEKGLLGAQHLAKRLKAQNLDLYAMLNFEMIGVPLVDKDYLMYVTGYENSNLAEIMNGYAGEKMVGFLPTAKEFNLFQRSDNYPFHTEFGLPSQTFCTFDFTNFDHYHKVGDEMSIMDLNHMAFFINKTIPVLERVINAPSREIKYH